MTHWIQSDDGSYTAYSPEYNEHYHSTKDGALNESLKKHIVHHRYQCDVDALRGFGQGSNDPLFQTHEVVTTGTIFGDLEHELISF